MTTTTIAPGPEGGAPRRRHTPPRPLADPPGGCRARATTLARATSARLSDDRGAATAEYAIATLAAVGFAGALVLIMRSDEVRGFLLDIVRQALQVPE